MYYTPKPIRSTRLTHYSSPAQHFLKKLGKIAGLIVLVIMTAKLFALMEKSPSQNANQQANLSGPYANQINEGYLQ